MFERREHPCMILDFCELGARVEAQGINFGPSLVTIRYEHFGALSSHRTADSHEVEIALADRLLRRRAGEVRL